MKKIIVLVGAGLFLLFSAVAVAKMGIGTGLTLGAGSVTVGGAVSDGDALLLESGDYLLLETGDKLLLE